jgi:hypothetical protein
MYVSFVGTALSISPTAILEESRGSGGEGDGILIIVISALAAMAFTPHYRS